jgi:site-specific recombinase XerD
VIHPQSSRPLGRRPTRAAAFPPSCSAPRRSERSSAPARPERQPATENRALIAVLYRGGLRISEALALYPKDIDQAQGTVTVLHGKGDKRRTVGMDPAAFALVERWLDKRRAVGIGPRRPLFCTLEGRRLDASYVRRLLPRLARKAGIEKRVHAHGLRHAHAAELAAEGVPVNVVQQQLGHGSLATTDRYLRHIAPRERVEAMRERSWEL